MKDNGDNPDRAVIAAAMTAGQGGVAMATSPLLIALGCRIERAARGEVEVSFAPSGDYLQGHGVISGGITATMLDYAMAFAALTTCGEGDSAVSVGLNVVYLAPVHPGRVTVEARLLNAGYRLAQAEARLLSAEGTLLATGQSPIALKRRG